MTDQSIAIQTAFDNKDAAASRDLHDHKHGHAHAHSQDHDHDEGFHSILGSDFIKSIIYGGLDGIITTFSVICSAYASSLTPHIILVMGVANVLADGISMGHGDYFSEKAEVDYVNTQYKREKWEMDHYLEGEVTEMVELYTEKYSIPEREARGLLENMVKYPTLFLDHMMVVELELMPPDNSASPLKNGIVTFSSFVFFGMIPLAIYVATEEFVWACVSTAGALGILGWVRGTFTKDNRVKSAFVTILNGACSAGVAYGVSALLV